ncbi:MAG: radical SAM protein [Clostridia bacterium]|nr:radical SAM protein [Clostridia bacterium]
MSRHLNIPIFIPHLGCPHTCVFCNQRSISGTQSFDPESVDAQIMAALATTCEDDTAEIAYFGGSFTGIDRELMIYLLDVAERYVQKPLAGKARVQGIRMSTRPDYISEEIIRVLSHYSVRTVELGVQSMDDAVLVASGRGHDAKSAEQACRLLSDAGYDVVGQMMIGLPGSTVQSEVQTAKHLCELGVRAARIYPTVVFANTKLCALMQSGAYVPLTQSEAVSRSAVVLEVFLAHGVPVIRIGLCASDNLSDPACAVAGANHPAMGELVRSELYYRKLRDMLHKAQMPVQTIYIPARELSMAIGQHRQNLLRLREEFGNAVRLEAADCPFPTISVKETEQCT